MLLLHLFPEPHPMAEAFLDAFMLLLIVSPTLYFFLFRPFMHHLRRQQQSEAEIRILSRRLMAATEQERKRVAMDLHDHFGQVLTSLQLGLEGLRAALARKGAEEDPRCGEMIATVRRLGEDIRGYAACLRPAIIDDLGLVPALDWLVGELGRQHPEMHLCFRAMGVKRQPPPLVAEMLYRISQEALSNAIRHARAHRIEVTLLYSHPRLILAIRDDGIGCPSAASGHGLGLWSMRERAALIGGSVRIAGRPGEGTVIRVEVPLSDEGGGVAQ
jgi:signal transduction histidine kinase